MPRDRDDKLDLADIEGETCAATHGLRIAEPRGRPRALSAAAMAASEVTPAAWISGTKGKTLLANRSAAARFAACAFTAASAARGLPRTRCSRYRRWPSDTTLRWRKKDSNPRSPRLGWR